MVVDLNNVGQFGDGFIESTSARFLGLGRPGWLVMGETSVKQSFALAWPAEGTTVRNGSVVPILWASADTLAASADNVQLQMLLDHNVVHTIGTVPNTGSYRWVVPEGLATSDRYRLFLQDPLSRYVTALSTEYMTITEQPGGT